MTKKLATVAFALGAALAGSVTTAAATTGVQLAACTSANFGAHVVWLKFTKTDGSTFCVGGGTGTVTVNADITAWTGWSDTMTSPATEYYGFLHYSGSGTGSYRIGDWGSAAPIGAWSYTSATLPCIPPPPPYSSLCSYPLNRPSLHVDTVEIDGTTSF
ncbi:hypothetical protein GCM10009839_26110 [Catenulispora yoronensis]|uniref:Secreted protein n=1 Tax=Catenulispora yoronensis TaxID=450799 RepID=A0ABP5FJL8_9ACTN